MVLNDQRLDWELLERFRFDRRRFEMELQALKNGSATQERALFRGTIEPVSDVVDANFEDANTSRGTEALRRGRIAVVVLNGGMATRFGNVVKGVVEVDGGRSFLSLKAEDVRRASENYGAPISLVLMNSFATHDATMAAAAAEDNFGLGTQLLSFCQSISLRLTESGDLFIEDDGLPGYYAPGHGDFFASIRASGVLAELSARGVDTLLFSNVDNLGATIDPALIGQHLGAHADLTAEVTEKRRTASGAWDKGGAPAKIDGQRQLVEGFRLPPDLPPTLLPDFSTNNFLFSVPAIDRELKLERHRVDKNIEGRTAIQFESIACEASALMGPDGLPLLSLHLIRVPREGPRGRFFPVKERADLDSNKAAILARLNDGWALRDG